jgi:hypothetical protein
VNDFDADWTGLISNNKIRGEGGTVTGSGIKLIGQDDPTAGKRLMVHGNMIDRVQTGIWVEKLTEVIVNDNNIANCTYPLRAWTNSDPVIFVRNQLHDNTDDGNTPVADGTSAVVSKQNYGFITEAKGTAQVDNGSTSETVTHGIEVTPTLEDIQVTPTSTLGSATEFYVANVTATQFDIVVDVDPTQNITFAWNIAA